MLPQQIDRISKPDPLKIALAVAVSIFANQTARAVEPQLLRAVPRDHLAVILLDHSTRFDVAATQPASGSDFLTVATGMLRQLRAAGVLGSGEGGVVVDVVTSVAVLSHHPYAVVVIDAGARDLPGGGHRLANLQLAVIALTRGDNAAVSQQIQTLLSAHTDATNSRITTGDDFGGIVYSLTDSRLPEWATMHWAAVGDFYVCALGDAAMRSACATILGRQPDVTADAWFRKQHGELHGEQAQIEWEVRLGRIEERLANVVGNEVREILEQLGLAHVERGHWTVGRRGRAIVASAAFQTQTGDRIQKISQELQAGETCGGVIPAEADTYAVIPHPLGAVIRRASSAYLAARSPKSAAGLRNAWSEFEQQSGLDIDTALLSPMGDRIIVHTYPVHPLKIPLLCSILIPIDGPAPPVREALDALMTQINRWLAGDRTDDQVSAFAPRMRRQGDVWYVQAGIYGPGVTIMDGWMVISYSPDAVRRCVQKMNQRPAANTKGVIHDP